MNYRASKKPEKPITIWAYEASPFCMQTRERLTELELPHLYKNCARNSMKRDEITAKWGALVASTTTFAGCAPLAM